MKRTLCILLSLMLAVTGFAGLCVPAAAADWQTGDVVTLGSYPQSRVTDDATIASLNAAAGGWKSYGYYSGTGSLSDGGMSAKDYMQYCDVTVDGQKYRGVQFTQYRPKITGYGAWADNSYQDDNGYTANTVYWFRYEPLNWRVLDPTTGLVLCETVIDSQPVNNYALSDAGKYYGDADKTHYANNYAESSVRAWLNDAFYATAFTALQQNAITETTLDNSAYSTGFSSFDSASTTDKVFLLSYREAQNTAYGFSGNINANDAARQAEGTDYAKCQGVNVAPGGTSPWWLRSAGYTSAAVCSVHAAGSLYYNYNAYYTYYGIRPAMTVDPDALVVPYQNGDIIEFGSYLQGKLVNEDSIAALEAAAPDFSQWTSYGYYIGTGNEADGQMTASDYMRWCEITLDGKQYRGVRFTQYRPWKTDMRSTKSASEQDDHGYETDTTFWFRYRPLEWRVLDAEKGILLCETIIDSQPINSYVIKAGTDDYGETAYWGDADQSRYANDYAQSDLRQWLNSVFLNMAFSPQEQAVLTNTTLDNSADENVSRPAYGSSATADRVFLLSYADAQNAAYGFTDSESRRAKSSGYAKCQGVDVTSNYSPWLLRSPGNSSRDIILINYKGDFVTTNYAYTTDLGIRPAVSADLRALYALQNIHAYGAPVWDWADDYSSATATFTCADCGDKKTATDKNIDVTVVSAADCTNDRVEIYTASVTFDGADYTDTTNEVTIPDTALGHDYSVVHETVAPTINAEGYTLYACSRCGDVDPTHRDFVPAKQIEATDKPVQLVKDGYASNISGSQESSVWFGSYKQSKTGSSYNVDPVKWRVLSNADGKLFLLSDQNLDVFFYHERYRPTTWETCDMRKWLNDLAPYEDYDTANFMSNAFAPGELGAVMVTELQTDGSNPTQDKVFLLSVDDVQNAAYGFTDDASRLSVNTQYVAGGGAIRQGMYAAGTPDYWWLRTQGAFDDRAAIVNNTGYLDTHGYDVYNNGIAVRPAFNLDLSKVLFACAAEGGKPDGGLQVLPKYTGNEWKLTMLDDSRSGFTASGDRLDGDVWTIRYSGAETGENEMISAMIVDADGVVTCYGVLGAAEAGDDNTLTVDLSGKYRAGDTLYVFNEQINGDKKTDYASDLQQIAKLSDLYVGKIVEFGSYPQSRVTDDATLDALNDAAPDSGNWTSYGYYSSDSGDRYDGQMTAKDYMLYCDVTVGDQKYRGVTFSQYRPFYTGYTCYEGNSSQDDNGYRTGETYWFRYDPLYWRVLDPDTGLMLSETVIDSQPYNNYILYSDVDGYVYWGDADKTHYANNHAESSLRQWLNDDFYNTAFTEQQKNAIAATTLDNSAYDASHSAYDSAPTTDKVFLLSWDDVLNTAYGFNADASTDDPARKAERISDYAKCQGVFESSNECCWWLRSAGRNSNEACYVDFGGQVYSNYYVYVTNSGVRPAITMDPDVLSHDHAYGEPVWDWADDHTTATATFTCAVCGDTQTVDASIGVSVVSEEWCTTDRVVTYTAGVTFDGTDYTDTTDAVTLPGTALGHDYSVVHETVEPTFTEEGYSLYECSRCGDVDPTHRDIVDALTPPPDTVYQAGDLLEFGSYPQSRVTDDATIDALNAAPQTWQSYGYYNSGTNNMLDGQMTASDYMQYCDVTVDGQKYRGVRFTQYRPRYTGGASAAVSSYQDDNGYAINFTYWFLYEPLQWRVLDPAAGLVLCATVIDSQPYNSFVLKSGTDASGNPVCWGDADMTHYANDYEASDIRAWLNDDFYNTAFLTAQNDQILLTTLDNSACKPSYSAYDSAPTTDKVFLLSYGEALNTAYGFDSGYMANDPARQAQGTDYAKCQGLQTVGTKQNAYWRLRSAGGSSNDTCLADSDGWLTESFLAYTTCYGIRPAMRLGYVAFNDYKAEQKAAADALAQAEGSKICPVLLEEAKDRIDAIVYDSRKTMDENKAAVDAVIAALESGAFNHDYDAVVTDPTCTEKGYTTYACSHCKDTYTDNETEKRGHDYSVVHETVAPNCTEEGYTTYECSRCGDVDPTHKDVVGTTDHTYTDENWTQAVAADCGNDGSVGYYTCTGCGQRFDAAGDLLSDDDVRIPATGKHDYSVVHEKVDPTCTDDGYTVYACSVCGDVDPTHKDVVAARHAYGEPVWNWADDHSSATATFTCTDCGETQTVDASIDVTVVSAEDCTNDRVVTYTASVKSNGTDYTDTTDEVTISGTASGHNWEFFEWDWRIEPTLKYTDAFRPDIYYTVKCSACGEEKSMRYDKEIPVFTAFAPTCTEDGWTQYFAPLTYNGENHDCTYIFTADMLGDYAKATGHDWDEWRKISETQHQRVCKNDSSHTEKQTHQWGNWTIIDADNHKSVCSVCGAEQTRSHLYGSVSYIWMKEGDVWKATASRICQDCNKEQTETVTAAGAQSKAPTCTVNGETTYTATFSNPAFETKTKTVADIDALNHDWNTAWSKDSANHWHDCTRCDEKNDEAAHTYGEVSYTWEQTGDAWKATAKHACTICGWEESETVNATGAQSKAPTCTVNGETTYTAQFENPAFETQVKTVADIAALDHDWKTAWSKDGVNHWHDCTRCDAKNDEAAHTYGEVTYTWRGKRRRNAPAPSVNG